MSHGSCVTVGMTAIEEACALVVSVGDPRVVGNEVRQDETGRELEGKRKGIDQGRARRVRDEGE